MIPNKLTYYPEHSAYEFPMVLDFGRNCVLGVRVAFSIKEIKGGAIPLEVLDTHLAMMAKTIKDYLGGVMGDQQFEELIHGIKLYRKENK